MPFHPGPSGTRHGSVPCTHGRIRECSPLPLLRTATAREAVVTPPPPRPFLQSLGTASHSIPPPRLSPDRKNEEKQARLGVAGPHCAGRAQSCICRAHTDGGGLRAAPRTLCGRCDSGLCPTQAAGAPGPGLSKELAVVTQLAGQSWDVKPERPAPEPRLPASPGAVLTPPPAGPPIRLLAASQTDGAPLTVG